MAGIRWTHDGHGWHSLDETDDAPARFRIVPLFHGSCNANGRKVVDKVTGRTARVDSVKAGKALAAEWLAASGTPS